MKGLKKCDSVRAEKLNPNFLLDKSKETKKIKRQGCLTFFLKNDNDVDVYMLQKSGNYTPSTLFMFRICALTRF